MHYPSKNSKPQISFINKIAQNNSKSFTFNNQMFQKYKNQKNQRKNSVQQIKILSSRVNKKSFKQKQNCLKKSFQLNDVNSVKTIQISKRVKNTINQQKAVQKSGSSKLIIKNSALQHQQLIKIKKISISQYQTYKNCIQWRSSTSFPIIKAQLIQKKLINNQFVEIKLKIPSEQQVVYTLNQIKIFNLHNQIYILKQALIGFQRLYDKFGTFQLIDKHVVITKSMKAKVWLNQDYFSNNIYKNKLKNQSISTVQSFYQNIIKLFIQAFNTKSVGRSRNYFNLIKNLYQQLKDRKNFVQALTSIKDFLLINRIKPISRYIDYENSNQPRILSFSRSNKSQKAPSKLGNSDKLSNRKPKQQAQNKIQRQCNKMQQKVIQRTIQDCTTSDYQKTLKNSMSPQYNPKQKQSTCKTIANNSEFYSLNSIDFKKNSQFSICSKQTIPQKNSRFSIQQKLIESNQRVIEENEWVKQKRQKVMTNKQKAMTNKQKAMKNRQKAMLNNQKLISTPKNLNFISYLAQTQPSIKNNTYQPSKITITKQNPKLIDYQQYQQQQLIKQIEQNIIQRNGWFLNPSIMQDINSMAYSIQDGEEVLNVYNRDRALTKLNRIKKSIANSILQLD